MKRKQTTTNAQAMNNGKHLKWETKYFFVIKCMTLKRTDNMIMEILIIHPRVSFYFENDHVRIRVFFKYRNNKNY